MLHKVQTSSDFKKALTFQDGVICILAHCHVQKGGLVCVAAYLGPKIRLTGAEPKIPSIMCLSLPVSITPGLTF